MSFPIKLTELQSIAYSKEDFRIETSPILHQDLYDYATVNKSNGYGIIEIGCFKGASSIVLSYICMELGQPFYTIDISAGNMQYTENLLMELGLAHNATFYVGTMETFIQQHKLERSPLLVFIDGDHSYEGVCKDIKYTMMLDNPPYAIAFHDFSLRSNKYKNINVDKAILDTFGDSIRYRRIGIQFDTDCNPDTHDPNSSDFFWDYNGSEGIIIELNKLVL